jgi:hypothetical protein
MTIDGLSLIRQLPPYLCIGRPDLRGAQKESRSCRQAAKELPRGLLNAESYSRVLIHILEAIAAEFYAAAMTRQGIRLQRNLVDWGKWPSDWRPALAQQGSSGFSQICHRPTNPCNQGAEGDNKYQTPGHQALACWRLGVHFDLRVSVNPKLRHLHTVARFVNHRLSVYSLFLAAE